MTTPISYDNCIEYLNTVDTPTLSNAIELLKVRPHYEGFMPLDVRCLFPELGRLCGYAVTAQVETMTRMEPPDRRVFLRLYEELEKAPKPAVIAFQEIGPQPEYAAHCGEVMGTIFTRLGAIGLVSDSGVRDIPEVRAMGFRYFARGAAASHAYFHIVRVGVPIQIRGVVVRPGDILHGDENGMIVVPREGIEKAPEAVEQVRSRERDLMSFVKSPDFTLEKLQRKILE